MDPFSTTASVIAVATAALQSAKALYDVVHGLVGAPGFVTQTRSLVSQTQTTLGALTRTLESGFAAGAVDTALREIGLEKALESTNSLCQEFTTTITRLTSHSTVSRFSTRDRFSVLLNDSKINGLKRDLADCQRTITLVLSSITLIVSSHTSGNVDQLRMQFDTQELALADLGVQLQSGEAYSQSGDHGTAAEEGSSAQLATNLQELCRRTQAATRAERTRQKFGDMRTDNHSTAMQGIVGVAQTDVEQSFGSLTTTTNSRAFQGQMDASSFGKLFGK